MVLPVGEKYGIPFLTQHFLTKQLGIFSKRKINPELVIKYLSSIPEEYKFIHLHLNKFNFIKSSKWKLATRFTYELDLIFTSKKLISNYSKTLRNILNECKEKEFTVMKNLTPNDFFQFWNSHKATLPINKNSLRRVLAKGIQYRICKIYGVYSKYNNLIASGIFFSFQKKTTLLITLTYYEEENYLPIIWMIHQFILEHAGTDLTLIFEPQDIRQKLGFSILSTITKRKLKTEELFKEFRAQICGFPVIENRNVPFLFIFLKPFLLSKV